MEQTNQKSLRFSKKNAYFLKNTCEKYIKIKIDEDRINKAISLVLQLKKFMYIKRRARKLKNLYKNLRSPTRIIKYLENCGETNLPNRQTITEHLKRYFDQMNEDYDLWLKKYPIWRIGVENNRINYFPKELRNKLLSEIAEILKSEGNKVRNFKIKKILRTKKFRSNLIIMSWLENSSEFTLAINSYLDSLIYFVKKLLYLKKNNITINHTKLSKDIKIHFNRQTISLIIDFFNKEKILTF